MADLPCKNPNCGSHGQAHPNCRCYGEYAEGGEVKHYCSSNQPHKLGCEYYAEGGLVTPPIDHGHSVLGYLSHHGLSGLLRMHKENSEKAMERYHQHIGRGHKKLEKHLDHIFADGKLDKEDHSKAEAYIDEWIKKGGVIDELHQEHYNQNSIQNFAEGGEVKKDKKDGPGLLGTHPVESHHPEQSMMIAETRARASQYLNSLRPQEHLPKLAFDKEPNQRQQEKAYKNAIKIASNPMSVLAKIKKGNLQPDDIKNFNALYPEMSQAIQKRMVEKITEDQLKGKKPSYKIRQSMSLFLGVPLSSEMRPQSIAAIQAVFKSGTAQPQEGKSGAPASKTKALAKSSQAYLTANSAAASRQQKQ